MRVFSLIIALSFAIRPEAMAWDKHQTLMVLATDSAPALRRNYLFQSVKLPSVAEEKAMIEKIAAQLQINAAKIPVFTESPLAKTPNLKVRDLIQSDFIDEPDFGMDQDLPDSADPNHDRDWMGGVKGPTSQGFRHMYFPGMDWWSPIDGLQIPFRSIGQAPSRFEKLRALSTEFFEQGNWFWGIRTRMWSLHFAHDLTQPFHVTQVPYFRMIPWGSLFSNFVSKSTHAMANYHFAYEGLVLEYTREARMSEFNQCFDLIDQKPNFSIHDVIQKTRAAAPGIGKAIYELLGDRMKDPDVDLPADRGSIDYYQLLHQKENEPLTAEERSTLDSDETSNLERQIARVEALKKIRQITCGLMRDVASYTWAELDRAFTYTDTVINTAK